MGNCSNAITQQTHRKVYEQCPTDTGNFDKLSSLRRTYEGILSGVKIQSVSPSFQNCQFQVDFHIEDIPSMTCQLSKVHQKSIKWFFRRQFKLFLNDYQIRTKFLKISIKNEQKKKVYGIKINLYRILSGPFHHDFSIGNKNKCYGRLIFDIKLSQMVHVELNTTNAKIQLNKQYPGDKFNFVIQSHVNSNAHEKMLKNKLEFKSIPSYKQAVPLQRQISKQQIALSWSRRQKVQMPTLKFEIKSSQILSTVFTLKLYKFLDEKRFAQFGQFGFTLSELMSAQVTKKKESNSLRQFKFTKVEKNLNSHGKIQGKCQLQLEITFDKFVAQAINSCQTEDGIVNMHHHELYKAQSETECESALQACLSNILALTQQKPSSSSFIQRSAVSSSICSRLRQLHIELLKNSRHCFVYKDRKSRNLQMKKVLFVQILDMLSCLIEEDDIELSQHCWDNVIAIMGRPQMMIKYWEFDDQQEEELVRIINKGQAKQDRFINHKVEVSLEYLRIMHKLLKLALETQIQNSIKGQKKHCQIFKAYCYFRIPSFRQRLLSSISTKLQQNTDELSKKLSNVEVFALNNQQIPLELDWYTRFEAVLQLRVDGSREMFGDLEILLKNHEWFKCVAMVSENQKYCNFVRYLLAKFGQARQAFKLQKWIYFEGYSIIVKGFLYNLNNIELSHYENYLIVTIMSLLQNEKLTSLLLQTLFKKTNLYDQSSILRLAFVLTHILHALTKNKYLQNFPYATLMLPMKNILEGDHSLSLSYFLTFLYTFYEKFQKTFRYELGSYLIGKLFWKLCFNWSHNVRNIFFHFLVLKIGQDQPVLSTTDMGQKLDFICRIIANSELAQLDDHSIKSSQRIEGEKHLHKALKKKLIDKKNLKITKKQNLLEDKRTLRSPLSLSELSKFVIKPQYQLEIVNYANLDNQNSNFESENSQNLPSLINRDMNIPLTRSTQPLKPPKLQPKFTYLSHKLIYPCFHQSDCNQFHNIVTISQLNENQSICHNMRQYMRNSGKQFRTVLGSVDKHYRKFQQLPVVQFQFKFQVDQRDILPDGFRDICF